MNDKSLDSQLKICSDAIYSTIKILAEAIEHLRYLEEMIDKEKKLKRRGLKMLDDMTNKIVIDISEKIFRCINALKIMILCLLISSGVLLTGCESTKKIGPIEVHIISSGYSSGLNGYDEFVIATDKGMYLSRVNIIPGCYIINYVADPDADTDDITGFLGAVKKCESL